MAQRRTKTTKQGATKQGATNGGRLIDEAYRRLKQDIICHRLRPGQKVSEARLAEWLGLGKAPVRPALSRLVAEGFIVSPSPKTHLVAPLTLADINHILTLREMLEPSAARMAVGRIDIDNLVRLNKRCERPYTRGRANEELAFLVANRDFHMAIAEASGNPLLVRWIAQLQDLSLRILWLSLRLDDRPGKWSHGHAEILDALRRRDRDEAEELARKHLVTSRELIGSLVIETAANGASTGLRGDLPQIALLP